MKSIYILGILLFAYLVQGLDVGMTELPYHSEISEEISEEITGNGTYEVSYGRFLSGPENIVLNDKTTMLANVIIPKETMPGVYTTQLNLSDFNHEYEFSYEYEFRIINDVVFDVKEDQHGTVGKPYNIFLYAPVGASALVVIEDFQETFLIDESEQVWYIPKKAGEQQASILFIILEILENGSLILQHMNLLNAEYQLYQKHWSTQASLIRQLSQAATAKSNMNGISEARVQTMQNHLFYMMNLIIMKHT